jgi:SET and MYND domain-containing protein 4
LKKSTANSFLVLFVANDISIILANRSAVLYHQQQYDACLKEIQRATDAKYPKDMMYKLKERKARCLLAKKFLGDALKAFQETVQALDDSNLPHDKKMKLERDAQIMIKMLTKNVQMEEAMKKSGKLPANEPPAKKKSKETVEHFVSDTLSFDFNEEEGRFAKAATDIKLGTYLVQEKPHVACLLQLYSQTHCQCCFKRVSLPIACQHCADVIFCSAKCRDKAWNSFHKTECGIMQHLWNSGASITCQMALRAIAQHSLKYFLDMKGELEELRKNPDYERLDKLANDDYRRVFVLVTHEKDRTFEDIFHRVIMASFLTYCLKIGGFFEGDDSAER